MLENWNVHALRDGRPPAIGIDPWSSTAWLAAIPKLVCEAEWWMLRVGAARFRSREELRAA